MIDAHCHLNFKSFEDDVGEVIARAKDSGITTIVNAGTQIPSSKWAVELAEKHTGLFAAVGVHPHHADKVGMHFIEELGKLADSPNVIAVGEIGLDYYAYKSNGIVDPKIQEEIFRSQVELSITKKLPLQIHNRHAGHEVVAILKEYKSRLLDPPGMFHCFASDIDVLKNVLNLGFYIGFDGNSTYKGLAPGEKVSLPDIIVKTPVERILIETDSPYLAPIPLRGTRNEPKNGIIVAEFVARIKDVPYETFNRMITRNFMTLFKT